MQAESSYYSPQKVKSKEVLCWEQEGTTIEVIFSALNMVTWAFVIIVFKILGFTVLQSFYSVSIIGWNN